MPLYELTKTAITALDEETFSNLEITERSDLQALLKQNISVVAPDTLVIAEEFCEWEDSKRRIDLLGLDRLANLVVIELKRTEDGGHMELQAIRYAAMVSPMTFARAVEVYGRYLKQAGSANDPEAVIRQFLKWEDTSGQFAQDVRILLVSAEFSKEITTSVLWLRDRDVDIRCIRLRPYALDSRIVLDVQQVIPLPEADEYTIQLKKKAEENREARRFEPDFTKYDLDVDGMRLPGLSKRALMFQVVKAARSKGISPEQIGTVIPPGKWISVEGELGAEGFQSAISSMQGKLGGKYDPKRYFCDLDDELFHDAGRTYALSNQWGLPDLSLVKRLISMLPTGGVSYADAVTKD